MILYTCVCLQCMRLESLNDTVHLCMPSVYVTGEFE